MLGYTREQVAAAVATIWLKNQSAIIINMAAMISLVGVELEGAYPFPALQEEIRTHLNDEVAHGNLFFVPRGRSGGFYRTLNHVPIFTEMCPTFNTINPRPLKGTGDMEDVRAIPRNTQSPAVNNHTCPSCGNNRCSKDEKSCWSCGGRL